MMSKITHLTELRPTAVERQAVRVNHDVGRRAVPNSRTATEVFADARRIIAGGNTSSGILDMLGIRRDGIEHGHLVYLFKEIARELPYTTQHERSIMVAWLGTRAHVLAEKIFRGRSVPREAVVNELKQIEKEYPAFYRQINGKYGGRPILGQAQAFQETRRWYVPAELDLEAGALVRHAQTPQQELGKVVASATQDPRTLVDTETVAEIEEALKPVLANDVVEVDPQTVEEIEEALGNGTVDGVASDDPRSLLRV